MRDPERIEPFTRKFADYWKDSIPTKKKARQENKRLPGEEICDYFGKEIENNS